MCFDSTCLVIKDKTAVNYRSVSGKPSGDEVFFHNFQPRPFEKNHPLSLLLLTKENKISKLRKVVGEIFLFFSHEPSRKKNHSLGIFQKSPDYPRNKSSDNNE